MKPTPCVMFLTPPSLMTKDLFSFGFIYLILMGVSRYLTYAISQHSDTKYKMVRLAKQIEKEKLFLIPQPLVFVSFFGTCTHYITDEDGKIKTQGFGFTLAYYLGVKFVFELIWRGQFGGPYIKLIMAIYLVWHQSPNEIFPRILTLSILCQPIQSRFVVVEDKGGQQAVKFIVKFITKKKRKNN